MNELQIRLSADISALQSALTKAKQTIKGFEDSTNKESEKGNVGFKRKIGLIEQLTQKAKGLRTALEQATNEKDVARYNAELEDTSKQMTRLNALGRTLGNSTTGAAKGFNKLASSQGNANGVAIEFSRIIQDAPFGIIGIGNNLQQLTANFAQVSKSAGGAGAAIKASLASLISPANLLVLGISAVTAAFTAYQMGAFDFLKDNEEIEESIITLNDRLSDFVSNLGSVEKANLNASKSIETERIKTEALVSVIEDETKKRETRLLALSKFRDLYPGYLKGLSDEQILSEGLRDVYLEISDAITKRATALALEEELINLAKNKLELNKKLISDENSFFLLQQDFIKKETEYQRLLAKREEGKASAGRLSLAKEERDNALELLNLQNEIVTQTNSGLQENKESASQLGNEYKNIYDDLLEINSLTSEWNDDSKGVLRTYENISSTLDDILTRARIQRRADFFEGVESQMTVESGKALTQGIIIPDIVTPFQDQSNQILGLVDEMSNSFSGLGSLIGKAFDNTGLGQFVGEFLKFSSQIVAGAFAVSKANAIAGATQSSLFTGPAAAFTLPAFIAGAVGLVASAFSGLKGKGNSGGGGGGSIAAPSGRSFTNVGVPSQTSPSYSNIPVESNFNQSVIVYGRISGDDILISSQRAQEKRAWG